MKRKQWFALGIGLIITTIYLWWQVSFWNSILLMDLDNNIMIIKQMYNISGLITGFLGMICIICGGMEKKK